MPFIITLLLFRANSAEDAVRRGQRQVEQSKIKIGMQMDDKTFQSCLLETQVNGSTYRRRVQFCKSTL